jgi:8-oxo-dGTP pyrophosphatase MutT (NUDIX family)
MCFTFSSRNHVSPHYQNIRDKIGSGLLLIPSVAALIRDSSGAILLQAKSDGSWSLPAGAIEPGESPSEALAREVFEETGFIVHGSRMIGAFGGSDFRHTYPNGDQVEYTVLLYECTASQSSNLSIDEETVSLQFFSEERFPGLSLPYPQRLLYPK